MLICFCKGFLLVLLLVTFLTADIYSLKMHKRVHKSNYDLFSALKDNFFPELLSKSAISLHKILHQTDMKQSVMRIIPVAGVWSEAQRCLAPSDVAVYTSCILWNPEYHHFTPVKCPRWIMNGSPWPQHISLPPCPPHRNIIRFHIYSPQILFT